MSSVNSDLVSTIIPVYNRPGMLLEAVQSVLDQTYRPIEIIIVDDGSTDETIELADRLAREYPEEIKALHIQNGGPGLARESGRQLARGEFIQYLDSDDLLCPEKFEKQVLALRKNKDRDIACGFVEFCDMDNLENYKQVPWRRSAEEIDQLFPGVLYGRYWSTTCPLYRRTLVDAMGPWVSWRFEEDFEYDVRAGCLSARVIRIPEYFVKVRHHGGRVSLVTGDLKADQHQAESKLVIVKHIYASGINLGHPAVQFFARALFLTSRQLGEIGLIDESRRCFVEARKILKVSQRGSAIASLYALLIFILGYRRAAFFAKWYDDNLRWNDNGS